MYVPVSRPNSIGGSGMEEWAPCLLKVTKCLYQDYLKIYMDSHVLDNYVDIICIYSRVSIYIFNFSRSVKSKTSLYDICDRHDDR